MKKRVLKSTENFDFSTEDSADSENAVVNKNIVENKRTSCKTSTTKKNVRKNSSNQFQESFGALSQEKETAIADEIDDVQNKSSSFIVKKTPTKRKKSVGTSNKKKEGTTKKQSSASSKIIGIEQPIEGLQGALVTPSNGECNISVSKKTVKKASQKDKVTKTTKKKVIKGISAKTPKKPVVFSGSISDYDVILSNIKSVKLSKAEQDRRRQHQELIQIAQNLSNDTGYNDKLPLWTPGWLVVQGAREHNLKSIDVPFPLSAFTVVTGVSGSGKSSLVEDVLHRYLIRSLSHSKKHCGACESVLGIERVDKVVKVDQAPIGQSPTSNAATFTGVFDLIRQLFAQLPEAKLRRYSPRRFSFNVPGGRCEKCEGAGILKVEMHFLADVFITCDACGGKRYDSETLQVKYRGKSISDVLDMTCGEASEFFDTNPAIAQILRTLCDVGLDYLPLGQAANTLSGGEAQRIKLAAELYRIDSGKTVYILDEPTTGLHFEDVRKLLDVLQRLVDLGNTVIVVEHNLDVIKNADWIIEIGPEAGFEGGRLVFAGTPEQLIKYTCQWRDSSIKRLRSYTGEALIPVFLRGVFEERTVTDPRAYREALSKVENFEEDEEKTGEEVNQSSIDQPWRIDGKRWHTEFRLTPSGVVCKWDGRALSWIVEKLEEQSCLAETNWNNRTCVEIRSERNNSIWFMRADTNEEWLLSLKFRTAKNTFEMEFLTKSLALKPLKELKEVPLYGTLPRVKVENVGNWQEISLKVYSLEEINTPGFTNFLKKAVESFDKNTALLKDDTGLTPWKTQGRDWHLLTSGFYGANKHPVWTQEMLINVLDLIENIANDIDVIWTNKIAVPFSIRNVQSPWTLVFTKNASFLCVQINFPKGKVNLRSIGKLGFEPLVETIEDGVESLYLRFKTKDELDTQKLQAVLVDSYQKFKGACNEE